MPSKESLERSRAFAKEYDGRMLTEKLTDLLDETIREAQRAAYETAARVIDDEIVQRERTDIDHMVPINRLAEKIRALPQSAEESDGDVL